MQAHADKHAVLNVLVPVEHALGLARQATSAGEGLAQIMGPLEDMLRSMGPNKLAKAAGLGRDPETGAPLSERVDKVLVECGARQATVSQLQLDLTRCPPLCPAPSPFFPNMMRKFRQGTMITTHTAWVGSLCGQAVDSRYANHIVCRAWPRMQP